MKGCPFSSVILPSLNLPTRIFGPCRSHMMATVRPTLAEICLTSVARAMWSSAVPCEKLRRTTSTPARIIFSRVAGSLEAGPSVGRVLVERSMWSTLSALGARFQHGDRRQLLALEEFEESAAACRDVRNPVLEPELRNRGDGIAAAGDGEGRRLGNRLPDGMRALRERVELEDADRTVPHNRACRLQAFSERCGGARADV